MTSIPFPYDRDDEERELGVYPPDGRWEFPKSITFRPGAGQIADVNPPRFSWPYLPHVMRRHISERSVPENEFLLQISSSPDFDDLAVEVTTEFNFYNALAPLAEGRWYWRVRYTLPDDVIWSVVRDFNIEADTPVWDREGAITGASETLGAISRPRLLEVAGGLEAVRDAIRSGDSGDPTSAAAWADADWFTSPWEIRDESWWDEEWPLEDTAGHLESLAGTEITGDRWLGNHVAEPLMNFAFASVIAEPETAEALAERDELIDRAKAILLQIADWSSEEEAVPGGSSLSAPDELGGSKWTTKVFVCLAVCYDLWYDRFSEADRATLRAGIEWRVRLALTGNEHWKSSEDEIGIQGIAIAAASHPFENFQKLSLPILLMHGDAVDPVGGDDTPVVSQQLLDLWLHWITGVTNSFGDDGFNQGYGYGRFKSRAMMFGITITDLLLPDLNLGANPVIPRLMEWFARLWPLSITRVPFGTNALDLGAGAAKSQRGDFQWMARITGDGAIARRIETLEAITEGCSSNFHWLQILSATRDSMPEATEDEAAHHAGFLEGGWVTVANHSPFDAPSENDIGMLFQCRPRGREVHSFYDENNFAWYAFGQQLLAGGAGRNTHDEKQAGHGSVLLWVKDGSFKRQANDSHCPFVGRILAYREEDRYVHWIGEAGNAFGDMRIHGWLRHVLFVDERFFVIYDDVRIHSHRGPTDFAWIMHIPDPVADESTLIDGSCVSYQIGDVHARVCLHTGDPDITPAISIFDLEPASAAAATEDSDDPDEETDDPDEETDDAPAHSLRADFTIPNLKHLGFTAALLAWPHSIDDRRPTCEFETDSHTLTVIGPDDERYWITFDADAAEPETSTDLSIRIDPETYRDYAHRDEPYKLPEKTAVKSLIGGVHYLTEPYARERFDRPTWLTRWEIETNARVGAGDDRLCIRDLAGDSDAAATLWFRPSLDAQFCKDPALRQDHFVLELALTPTEIGDHPELDFHLLASDDSNRRYSCRSSGAAGYADLLHKDYHIHLPLTGAEPEIVYRKDNGDPLPFEIEPDASPEPLAIGTERRITIVKSSDNILRILIDDLLIAQLAPGSDLAYKLQKREGQLGIQFHGLDADLTEFNLSRIESGPLDE